MNQNYNILSASQQGTIIKCLPNNDAKNKIKKSLKKEAKSFLLTTFVISIVSIIALIILVAIHKFILEKIGFVIIKYALFIFPAIGALYPLYGIYNYFSKNKCIKKDNFECYIAYIEKNIENSNEYKLVGVNYEKGEFLKTIKPLNTINPNDKVLLIRIDGENYLADINQLNDSSLLLMNAPIKTTSNNN